MSNESHWNKWIQNLKKAIRDITNECRNAIIHRSKLALLSKDLQNFEKSACSISVSILNTIQPNFNALEKLVPLADTFQKFLISLSQENFLKTTLSNPVEFAKNTIFQFRINFNSILDDARINYLVPLSNKITQLEIDDCDDLKNLESRLQLLKSEFSSTQINQANVNQIEKCINDLNSEIKKYEITLGTGPKQLPANSNVLTASLEGLNMVQLDPFDFENQRLIGHGSFADVYMGFQKSTQKAVAIKILHPDSLTQSSRSTTESFRREIRVLSTSNHFSILKLIGICPSPPLKIVTELMIGGSLSDRLHSKKLVDPTKKTIIALGIAYGMAYLHAHNVIHRDLKSSNILLDADDFPRISDFGASCTIYSDEELHEAQGTAAWTAPEMLQGLSYTNLVDVYSFAVLLWEMLTEDVPFKSLTPFQITQEVTVNNTRPPLPPENICPPPLSNLINKCWSKNSKDRPSFDQISHLFETCEVCFPGTNQESVSSYVTHVKSITYENKTYAIYSPCPIPTTNPSHYPENQPGDNLDSIDQLLNQAISGKTVKSNSHHYPNYPNSSIYNKLLELLIPAIETKLYDLENSQNQTKIFNQLVPLLIKNAKTNNDPQFALLWMQFFKLIIEIRPQTLTRFDEAITLFTRFGTTSMTSFLDIAENMLPKTKYVFQSNEIAKLSSFLNSSDFHSRVRVISLLSLIVKNELYSAITTFFYVIPSLARNILPETPPAILLQIIELLQLLAECEDPPLSLSKNEVLSVLFNLYKHSTLQPSSNPADQSQAISDSSFNLLKTIFTKLDTNIDPSFINEFLRYLNEFQNSGVSLLNVLALLSILSHSDSCFEIIKASTTFPETLIGFLQFYPNFESSVMIYILKLCYYFIAKRHSGCFLAGQVPQLIKIMMNQNTSVATLSAFVLTVLIPEIGIPNDCLNDQFLSLLNDGIIGNDNYSLRVLGAIASTQNGSIFAEKFIPIISEYLSLMEKYSKHHHRIIVPQGGITDEKSYITPTKPPIGEFSEVSSETSKSSKYVKSRTSKIIKQKYRNNPENGPMAVDVLTVIAQNRLFSPGLIVCISQMSSLLDDVTYIKSVMGFIETVVVNPKAAEEAVSLFGKLISHLGTAEMDSHIFTALSSIVSAPEAASKIGPKSLALLVEKTKDRYWEGPFALQCFKILETLSAYPELKKKMIEMQVAASLDAKQYSYMNSVTKTLVLKRLFCRLNDVVK